MDRVSLTGDGPVLPSGFHVADLAQSSVAAATLAVAEVLRHRSGMASTVRVDRTHACAAFRSERLFTVNGGPPEDPWDAIAGLYRTGCGGWVRLHTNFPHHRAGIEALLGGASTKQAVTAALKDWSAVGFEEAALAKGMLAFALRTFDQWDTHPQGQAIAGQPPVTVTKIGDADRQPLRSGDAPLEGVRVLDLSRVLAGPVAGRTLAAHGADVLRVAGPHLPFIPSLVIDTGRGKRSCYLDLRTEQGRADLWRLVDGADVFIDAYRPGAIAGKGFDPAALVEARPGLIVATLSAFGPVGPWSDRRGFDSLVQAATGFNLAEAEAARQASPRALPCQALDHGAGYLLTFGIATALGRRLTEGGSWHVQVSLAGVGHWLRSLGSAVNGFAVEEPNRDTMSAYLQNEDSGFGPLAVVAHAGRIDAAPPIWQRPAMPLGSHGAAWSDG